MTKFAKDLDSGPRGSSVTKVEKENRDVVQGENAFEVRH